MNKMQKNLGLVLLVSSMGVSAATLDAQTGLNINNFDIFLEDGAGVGIDKVVSGVNQINWTGYALSDFGAGAPTVTGSVFKDYILLNATALTDQTGSTIFGTGLNSDYQITAVLQATGVITDGGSGRFSFTSLDSFGMYVDTLVGGVTQANYQTGTLATFTDGNKVLSGGALAALTVLPPSNVGILNPTLGATGEFNVQFQWLQDIVNSDFLRQAGTANSLFDLGSIISLTAGDVTFQANNINNVVSGTDATATSVLANIQSIFGVSAGANVFLANVSTTPDTNIATTVPEPSSIALLGLGILGFAARSRRNSAV